jgi:hypothetical protein
VPVTPQERQITSCRARAGQHARPSHKHCKACANHAYAPWSRVHTGLATSTTVYPKNMFVSLD